MAKNCDNIYSVTVITKRIKIITVFIAFLANEKVEQLTFCYKVSNSMNRNTILLSILIFFIAIEWFEHCLQITELKVLVHYKMKIHMLGLKTDFGKK